jgi:hypothetical protein
VGLFDGEKEQARRTLFDMYQRQPLLASPSRYNEWRQAQHNLRTTYTRESSETNSGTASLRLRYLSVAEPLTVREDFLPPIRPLPRHCLRALGES